jgi:hypothetical protein
MGEWENTTGLTVLPFSHSPALPLSHSHSPILLLSIPALRQPVTATYNRNLLCGRLKLAESL